MDEIKHVLGVILTHIYWIILILMQQYEEYVKFAFKSMDTVHMCHVHSIAKIAIAIAIDQ